MQRNDEEFKIVVKDKIEEKTPTAPVRATATGMPEMPNETAVVRFGENIYDIAEKEDTKKGKSKR